MNNKKDKIYDIIIIGAGPAGMTAAIYAGRAGKSVLILDKNGYGGNIINSPEIENIPGFTKISGIDFATNLYSQMTALSTVEHAIEEVKLITYEHRMFKVYSETFLYCGYSVIIASGTEHKKLTLDTPDVYYCVTCDGPKFKNKNVVVVGSGNTGATYALELASYCKHVYLCDITENLTCEKYLQEKIKQCSRVEWKPRSLIKQVKNNRENQLASVALSTGENLKCNAIFAAIGQAPENAFCANLVSREKNSQYIKVENNFKCGAIPGLYAVGDCVDGVYRQVTVACGAGATAALDAVNFLKFN